MTFVPRFPILSCAFVAVVLAAACDNHSLIGQQSGTGGRGGGTPGTAGKGGDGAVGHGGTTGAAGAVGAAGIAGTGGVGGDAGTAGTAGAAGGGGSAGTGGIGGQAGAIVSECPQQSAGSGGASFAFAAAVRYPTFRQPRGVALGDLDGDGKLDFATSNVLSLDAGAGGMTGSRGGASGTDPGSLSVLLSSENYATPHHYAAGAQPFSVAIGDLNGDGKGDLAATNLRDVSILFNAGGGSLGPAMNVSTGTNPQCLALGDVSGDGRIDMIVGNGGDGSGGDVAVLINTGTNAFGAANYPAGTRPLGVALGDLNGDGKADIAAASGTSVSVLLNGGTGVFGAPVSAGAGTNPASIAVGDLNGDGEPDLAVANSAIGGASVLLNVGNGTFTAATNYAYPGTEGILFPVALGDLNGDGKADLVVASTCGIAVLPNAGNGTFGAAQPIFAGPGPGSIALGDVNGDGKLDVVFATLSDGVGVLLNVH
ncbi:MAG TPA: VCBS repeat-containing protein [Polyangia bacterium]|jgi:hypothetical protein